MPEPLGFCSGLNNTQNFLCLNRVRQRMAAARFHKRHDLPVRIQSFLFVCAVLQLYPSTDV
jgi:hypothetical protein